MELTRHHMQIISIVESFGKIAPHRVRQIMRSRQDYFTERLREVLQEKLIFKTETNYLIPNPKRLEVK